MLCVLPSHFVANMQILESRAHSNLVATEHSNASWASVSSGGTPPVRLNGAYCAPQLSTFSSSYKNSNFEAGSDGGLAGLRSPPPGVASARQLFS